MTLPRDVQDAIMELDAVHDQRFAPWRNQWTTIRAHLLSQDAEIERLNGLWKMMTKLAVKKDGQIKDAESRLAAANAPLRDIKDWGVDAAQGACLMVPHSLRSRIQSHLQGADDEA